MIHTRNNQEYKNACVKTVATNVLKMSEINSKAMQLPQDKGV